MRKSDFGENFNWGVSTAAYQIEGAYQDGGKGLSIWDQFVKKKGNILNNDHANISADFYNRFEGDLALMKAMGIPNFRFSISWSRIFPNGTGSVNQEGVDFYNKLIDNCLEYNIEPWITLYHWDLPFALEKLGGWTNRDILHWFGEYASFCIRTFGDRVQNWMILNEPMVFTGAGYFLGVHAPGRRKLSNFFPAAHHAALCQAEGGRIIRSERNNMNIGTTFSYTHVEPYSTRLRDIKSASRIDTLLNRTFIEPLIGLGYPIDGLASLQPIEKWMKEGDDQKLRFNMDFIGLQCYTREIIKHSYLTPILKAKLVSASKRNVDRTSMNWEVYPASIYHCLKRVSEYPGIKSLIITENGASFPDLEKEGEIYDNQRKVYLESHMKQVLRAKKEGVDVNGYFVWSFIDNFEWAEGFMPRFGLVHINYSTQKRTIKYSGKWFKNFLKKPHY